VVKSVLVNGCSFSRGPDSWPYLLQDQLSFNLVNLAQAGAGNDYVFYTTMNEIHARKYDLVIIMWTGIDRVDYQVADINNFDSAYTSLYQSRQNDWPEKNIFPINDQDYVDKNWVFGCGHINGDKNLTRTGLFAPYYKFVDHKQTLNSLMVKIISLQNTLNLLGIPYVFSFYEDYIHELKDHAMAHAIDWKNLCIIDNINNITKRNQWHASDGSHPGKQAHDAWAKLVKEHICTNTPK
jgi:hypothetical protein